MTAPTRPVLQYHGGKFRIAPWILSHFPQHNVYVEPFGGAASVLLQKTRVAAEVYNDVEHGIVGLFRILREPYQAAELQRLMELTPFARDQLDWAHEPAISEMDAAHKLLVRSFLGRGSDASTRQGKAGFKTLLSDERALSAQAFARWPDCIPMFTERLRGVVVENRPAIEIIEQFDTPGTLIYADPPYLHSTRSALRGNRSKKHGYKHEMTDADHRDLASVLHGARGMVVLSGYPSDLYQELYADWQQHTTSSVADLGTKRTEVVWLNPACSDALERESAQQSLFAEVA